MCNIYVQLFQYLLQITDFVSSQPSIEVQNTLLQQTIQHPTSVAFPPSLIYKTAFLKELVKQVPGI